MPEPFFDVEISNARNKGTIFTRRLRCAGSVASTGRLYFLDGWVVEIEYPETVRKFATLSATLLLALLMTASAHAQKSGGEQKNEQTKSLSGVSKPAPPSVSNPKAANPGKITLYPASAQETADAILADSLGRLFDQADVHFHHGEYNHIYSLNRIVVQGDPHNMEAFSNSAYLLWSSDRSDEAVTFLKQGIKANPDTYYMYDELGTHYWLHMKDAASAIPYYEQAIKFKCPFMTVNLLAFCYEKTGAWDKAVETWRLATQLTDNTQAERHLAHALAERDKRAKQQ